MGGFDGTSCEEEPKKEQTVESQCNPAAVTFLISLCHALTEYFSIFLMRERLLMPSSFAARLLLPLQSCSTAMMCRFTAPSREFSPRVCLPVSAPR